MYCVTWDFSGTPPFQIIPFWSMGLCLLNKLPDWTADSTRLLQVKSWHMHTFINYHIIDKLQSNYMRKKFFFNLDTLWNEFELKMLIIFVLLTHGLLLHVMAFSIWHWFSTTFPFLCNREIAIFRLVSLPGRLTHQMVYIHVFFLLKNIPWTSKTRFAARKR